MTSRPSAATPILAVLAIVLATLGAYVGGYLLRSKVTTFPDGAKLRAFESYHEMCLFWPAMNLEGRLTGVSIDTEYTEGSEVTMLQVYEAP